jgi:hypothetical protein
MTKLGSFDDFLLKGGIFVSIIVNSLLEVVFELVLAIREREPFGDV